MRIAPEDRVPLGLAALLVVICVATAWSPAAGRESWALEVVPGLIPCVLMAVVYRRFRMSNAVYCGAFLQMMILVYGGYYTYAKTPLGAWAQQAFHLSRNHFDRVGHFALGFVPALATRELLLRTSTLVRSKWLTFLTWCVVFAFGAFWELCEWWTTLIVGGNLGTAFLGTQGDEWDAQADMMWVGIGGIVALAFFSRLHDRSMQSAQRASRA